MIPIKLRITGFTSYRKLVEIDFSGFDLACISGPNGAGKSSLLDAITYALYGEARKRDEAIINTSSTKAEVQLDFEYESQVYRIVRSITRGKGSQLEFLILNPNMGEQGSWKILTEQNMRATQAKIENTLRLDYETFVNAAFFLQGKPIPLPRSVRLTARKSSRASSGWTNGRCTRNLPRPASAKQNRAGCPGTQVG